MKGLKLIPFPTNPQTGKPLAVVVWFHCDGSLCNGDSNSLALVKLRGERYTGFYIPWGGSDKGELVESTLVIPGCSESPALFVCVGGSREDAEKRLMEIKTGGAPC
jgi:hypothetical protein